MKKMAQFAVFLMLCMAVAVGQSPSTVFDRIRPAIESQEVGWQMTGSRVEDVRFFQLWRNRAEQIEINYELEQSVEDAVAWLHRVADLASMRGEEALTGVGMPR